MHNKTFRAGPIALTSSIADLLSPPNATGGVNAGSSPNCIVLRHVSIVNKSVSSSKLSMYIGASLGSAAGTEVIGPVIVASNDRHDWYGQLRLDYGEYLTGKADASSALVITFEGEIGVAG